MPVKHEKTWFVILVFTIYGLFCYNFSELPIPVITRDYLLSFTQSSPPRSEASKSSH